jgi:hypothetical protein
MGGLETWRRTGALAATVALHLVAIIALVAAFHREVRAPSTAAFVGTLIILPASARRPEPVERERLGSSETLTPLRPAEPPPLAPLPISPPVDGTAIDWSGQARDAAATQAESLTGREIDPAPRKDGESVPQERERGHRAGESYRTDTGDSIVWISSRCYVISENPPPGTPQSVARARPSRTVCPSESSEARGDLFQEAQAYRKRHPR